MAQGYWRFVLKEALKRSSRRIREGTPQLIGFLVQTAILFAILYFQPWLGVVGDEAKLAGAGAISVILSGVFFFLWDLVRTPSAIYRDQRGFIKELSEAILEAQDRDAAVKGLSDRHAKGVAIFQKRDSNWKECMDEWEREFNSYLQAYFDRAIVHELISSYVIGWKKTQGNTTVVNHGSKHKTPDDEFSYFEYYAEKLNNINSRIPYADSHYLGGEIYKLTFAEDTIRRYGLPEHRLPQDTET